METGAFSKHRHAIWKENKEKAFVACSRFIATSPPLRPLSLWLLALPQPTVLFLSSPPFLAAGFICLAYTRTNRLGGLVLLLLAAGRLELRDGDLPPPPSSSSSTSQGEAPE